jgi:hypothetical protein
LLGDVYCVVPDPFETSRYQDVSHGEFSFVGVGVVLDYALEDLPVELVELVVLQVDSVG